MSFFSSIHNSDSNNSKNSTPGHLELTPGSTQPSPPISSPIQENSTASAALKNSSAAEMAAIASKTFQERDWEAVRLLVSLAASKRPTGLGKEANVDTPALAKEQSRGSPAPPTPPATPVLETLAYRDAAMLSDNQHEVLRPLIYSPASIYSDITIPEGFNDIALAKAPVHHPGNGAEHPSFAWAIIKILSLIPGHEMYMINLVRTILALWPNITKQETDKLRFEKGKRTLSAQITKATPVIQNVKSEIDDLINDKQYRIVRLVRQGEVVIMGPSKKTMEESEGESVEGGVDPAAKEHSIEANAPGATEKKAPATISKKRAAKDDESTPSKRQMTEAGPSAAPKKSLKVAELAAEKGAAKISPVTERRLGKCVKKEERGGRTGDAIGAIQYQKVDEAADGKAPMPAKSTDEAKRTGWVTANAGFVESKFAS